MNEYISSSFLKLFKTFKTDRINNPTNSSSESEMFDGHPLPVEYENEIIMFRLGKQPTKTTNASANDANVVYHPYLSSG